jgi:hypothetical protein
MRLAIAITIALALGSLTLPASSAAALPRLRAVIISSTSGAKLAETTGAPRPLSSAVGDARGGFLVAGPQGVARLARDGSVDPAFAAANSPTVQVALSAGVLVTAGPEGLRFLDPKTGAPVHPALRLAPVGTKVFVSSIAASGSLVFVVGSTQRGQNGSSQLAFGVNVKTGLRTAFHPVIRSGIATGVAASGSVVYLAGGFSTVGGAARCGLASVTAATGALRAWRSETCLGETPLAMTATPSSLFLGRLHGFLAVRADNGRRLTWSRRISQAYASLGVAALVQSGRTLYLGTSADAIPVKIAGQSRAGFAALNTTNGALLPWRVRVAARQNGHVLAVAGSRVLASGSFS